MRETRFLFSGLNTEFSAIGPQEYNSEGHFWKDEPAIYQVVTHI